MVLNKKLIVVFYFICITSALLAWGKKEASPGSIQENNPSASPDGDVFRAPVEIQIPERKTVEVQDEVSRVQVSGVVRLVGGGPIPELVITGQDREWHISKEEEYLLLDLQQQYVTVEGLETVTELKYASGIYAGEWRTLTGIIIMDVK